MISIMKLDRFGAPCPRPVSAEPGTLAEFGGGSGVTMRQRATRLVHIVSRPVFTAAPQTYLNGDVPPSVALHERSP